jgi:hypothetical protein
MQCFTENGKSTWTKPITPYPLVKVALEVPKGGPFLLVFFSLSKKSDLASVVVVDGRVTPEVSDPKGNVIVQLLKRKSEQEEVESDSKFTLVAEVRFKSWCQPCRLPICFQVLGQTKVKKCNTWLEKGGWCLLGQGEFTKESDNLIALRHTPLALEAGEKKHDQGISLFNISIQKGMIPGEILHNRINVLPALPTLFEEFVSRQKAWRDSLGFKNNQFKRISHERIAVHSGYIPRDIYYLNGITANDEYLEKILEIGFLGEKNIYLLPPTEFAERIVFSLTHFVNVTVDYQPDEVESREGVQFFEYFSKGLLRFQNKADCEDLAWYMTSLIEAIQDSKGGGALLTRAREVLEDYIAASAIVQGTAPEFRQHKYNVCLKPQPFISEDEDARIAAKMHVFHVTSFLFPKREFLECVQRGCNIKKFSGQNCTVKPEGKRGRHRINGEPTTCAGPCSMETVLTESDELLIPAEEALCLPLGRESPNATLIYGALIEVITNWFVKNNKGPQCLTFVAALQEPNGEWEIAPEDCHWGVETFAFIPSVDISPLIESLNSGDESASRFCSDIPVPHLNELPLGFEERFEKLKRCPVPLFNKRFFWRLSSEGGEYEHPMRKGVWVTPPSL